MATVQRVNEASVGLGGIPSVQGPRMATGRESDGLVRGLESVAGVVNKISEQAQAKADTASVLEARRKLGDWERQWFDPENKQGVYARRGRNAMGLVDEIQPEFERVEGELLAGLRSPKAREAFLSYATGTRESMLNRVNSYAVDENNKYVAEEFKASMTAQTDRAAQAALDGRWEDQARETAAGLQALRSMQALNGESEEVFKVREAAFLSSIHGTAVNGMLSRGQLTEASAYFDDNAEDIDPEMAGRLIATMRPQLLAENAIAFVDGFERGLPAPALGGDLTIEGVWGAQLRQESGNRQTDANGNPITSPKGAIGVAQVMPDTGPVAAKYAGLPWDPERFKTDRAYNEALGKAYMTAQVTTFGSVQLGLAAYNAGPGAVSKWIQRFGDPRKGEISIDEFVERIPYKETREYVQGIVAKSGRAKPAADEGRPGPTRARAAALKPGAPPPQATLEEKLAAVAGIPDREQRRAIETELRTRHALRKQAESETTAATLERVNTLVYQAPVGVPFHKIPGLIPEDVAFVTQKGHRDTYETIIQKRAEGTLTKTNPILFDTLRRQSVEDPEGFIAQREFILSNSHQFETADYESLLGRIATLKKPGSTAQQDWATEEQRVARISSELGFKPGAAHQAQRAAVSRAYMEAERELLQRTGGKKPTPEQLDAMARQVRQNLAEVKANGGDIVKRYKNIDENFQVDVASRQRAAARLRERNGTEPTETEITQYIAEIVRNRKPAQ